MLGWGADVGGASRDVKSLACINSDDELEACLAMFDATPQQIRDALNYMNDGTGKWTNDVLAYAIMGLAQNVEILDRRVKYLRGQSNALNSHCY